MHHAGTLLALQQLGLVPCAYAGASAGALVGLLGASGLDPRQVARRVTGARPLTWLQLAPRSLFSRDSSRPPMRLARFERWLRTSLGPSEPAGRLMVSARMLPSHVVVHATSGDMTGWTVASCAVPGLVAPLRIGGVDYDDAGRTERVPLRAAVTHFRPRRVIVSWLDRGQTATSDMFEREVGSCEQEFAAAGVELHIVRHSYDLAWIDYLYGPGRFLPQTVASALKQLHRLSSAPSRPVGSSALGRPGKS